MICCWLRRRRFKSLLTIELQSEWCVDSLATTLEFTGCPATLRDDALVRLTDATQVKVKVKRGKKTIGTQMMASSPIFDALLEGHHHKRDVPLSLFIETHLPYKMSLKVDFYIVGDESCSELQEKACNEYQEGQNEYLDSLKVPRRYRKMFGGEEQSYIMKQLQEHHKVTIEYNTRSGVMTLRGLVVGVTSCRDDVLGMIKDWQRQRVELRHKNDQTAPDNESKMLDDVLETEETTGCKKASSSKRRRIRRRKAASHKADSDVISSRSGDKKRLTWAEKEEEELGEEKEDSYH